MMLGQIQVQFLRELKAGTLRLHAERKPKLVTWSSHAEEKQSTLAASPPPWGPAPSVAVAWVNSREISRIACQPPESWEVIFWFYSTKCWYSFNSFHPLPFPPSCVHKYVCIFIATLQIQIGSLSTIFLEGVNICTPMAESCWYMAETNTKTIILHLKINKFFK